MTDKNKKHDIESTYNRSYFRALDKIDFNGVPKNGLFTKESLSPVSLMDRALKSVVSDIKQENVSNLNLVLSQKGFLYDFDIDSVDFVAKNRFVFRKSENFKPYLSKNVAYHPLVEIGAANPEQMYGIKHIVIFTDDPRYVNTLIKLFDTVECVNDSLSNLDFKVEEINFCDLLYEMKILIIVNSF